MNLDLDRILAVHSKTWQAFALIVLATLAITIVVILLGEVYGVSIRDLTRDPAAITHYPAYVGFVSQFGTLLWSASATACVLAYIVCRYTSSNALPLGITPNFLLSSAFLTMLLGIDDAFMLHDRIFPEFGVHELAFYILYGTASIGYFLVFLQTILRTEFLLLLSALSLFALSIITDLLFEPTASPFWFEDGTKGIGILCWFFYFTRTVTMSLKALADASSCPDSVSIGQ